MSASAPTGKKAANSATKTPVMIVTTCGVWNFGCTFESTVRQQAVAAHHEEDAGLAEHHHQDDRRQREAGGEADQVADLRPADLRSSVQASASFEQTTGSLAERARTAAAQLGRARRRMPAPAASITGCAPTRADHAGRDQQVEDRCRCRASRSGRSACCAAGSWSPRPRSRPRRSRHRRRRSRPPPPSTPGRSRSRAANGSKLSTFITGSARTTNSGQRGDLDRHQHRVDLRALARADHQQPGDEQGDDHGRQVDEPPRVAKGQRPGAEARSGMSMPKAFSIEQPDEIAGPADRDRAGGDGVFEDQRPADHPGQQLAHHRVAVGVGRARDRHHRGHLGIAERGDRADDAGDDEAQHHARARPSAPPPRSARRCRCR